MTTAFNIFVRQTIKQAKIPFEIYANPFYSESNMTALHKSIKETETGNAVGIIMTNGYYCNSNEQ